jgi:hypothetical protein
MFGGSHWLLAQSTSEDDFASSAAKLRQQALEKLSPHVGKPVGNRPVRELGWRRAIVTTVFAIGEPGGANRGSAWDPEWQKNYGGYDDPSPKARREFVPAAFVPRLNPFYVALPYNDVTNAGTTKPEARTVIPWFHSAFVAEGTSVCRDRWIAIRNEQRVAYAQWSDCGPYRTDHYQYVFGTERPTPNAGQGAGLCVSPAVRDYLLIKSTDLTDWKFVEVRDVPPGPWRNYGSNNPFTKER